MIESRRHSGLGLIFLIGLKWLQKKENRSLNNYVESVLLDAVYREPNEETLA